MRARHGVLGYDRWSNGRKGNHSMAFSGMISYGMDGTDEGLELEGLKICRIYSKKEANEWKV